MKMRWLTPLVATLVLAGCSGGGFRAEVDFAQTIAWDGYERIQVKLDNGAVELRSADVPEVVISGEKYVRGHTLEAAKAMLDDIEIYAGDQPGQAAVLLVEVRYPTTLRTHSPGARLVIEVPTPCPAEVRTGNGRITAKHLVGPVKLHSSNGRITVEDIDGDLEADTSNGRITILDVRGDCELSTSNGRVKAHGIQGTLHVDTSNGRVSAAVAPQADDRVELRSGNGRIELEIPAQLAASIEARTGNGRVTTELGDANMQHVEATNSSFKAEINGGGCVIKAVSSNGSIRVKMRQE